MPDPEPQHPDDEDGALDEAMRRVFGRSWRTGLASRALFVLGAAQAVLAAVPTLLPAPWVAAIGALTTFAIAAGMHAAKDDKVTGLPK